MALFLAMSSLSIFTTEIATFIKITYKIMTDTPTISFSMSKLPKSKRITKFGRMLPKVLPKTKTAG